MPTATGSTRCPGKRRGRRLGAPRFRSKRDNRQSIRLTRNGFAVRDNGRVYVAKVGDLRVEWSRPLPSVPSSCTVIREADGRYYVSFVVERDQQPLPPVEREVGVDLGLDRLAVLSGGEIVDNPRHLRSRAASSGPGAAGAVPQAARPREPPQGRPAGRRAAPQGAADPARRAPQTGPAAGPRQPSGPSGGPVRGRSGPDETGPQSINDASWSTLVRLIEEKAAHTAGPSLRSAAGIRRRVCARPAGTTTGPSRSPSGRGPARGAAPSTTATSTPRATCSPKDEGSPPGWRRSQTPVELMSDRERAPAVGDEAGTRLARLA